MPDIHKLKADFKDVLASKDEVHAVGVGLDDDGNKAVIIEVEKGTARSFALPKGLDEDNVVIRETDEYRVEVSGELLEPEAGRKEKHRPVPGGVSAGHVNITAGTVSYRATDGSITYTLSNNHVYADVNQGNQGDSIIQPGSADGGVADDQSAILADYIQIADGATVDVAWAEPTVEHTSELFELGVPKGEPRRPSIGDQVIKSGRTTGITTGEVQQVNATVNVNYGDFTAQMEDQFITSDMSEGGDSGSAVLFDDGTMNPAGLLFAGSSSATVMNYATNVESVTGLSLVTDSGGQLPTVEKKVVLQKVTQDKGNIRIIVADGQDNPVVGATVEISGATSGTDQTGSTGIAFFGEVPIGDYTVNISADGYQDSTLSISGSEF